MLDVHGCNANMQDRTKVIEFCKELVRDIDMEAIGEPWVEQTAMHSPDKAGFTLTQIIQTSSIVAHFIDEPGDIYLDVFSCKLFEIATVRACVDRWFEPKKVKVNYITRHAG